ncbi:MAG: YmdB family metallophosphoesterase, partial [Alicyclobacillus sp.]|nr:YmdB family metallophosphoesterase [Alicyclobacillus sp.]
MVRVLFIGDVVGKAGQEFVQQVLTERCTGFDLVVANGENATHGRGLNRVACDALYEAGVEIITLGNHTWDQRDGIDLVAEDHRVVRPANYPPGTPGRGYTVCRVKGRPFLILNLLGRAFLGPADCPFRTADQVLAAHPDIRHILVDMHAEATSEKLAMGWYLDGRVSAVVGTHTHVQTADERVLPQGTAYITDVGMVG